jgi:hypothetical protein
MCNGVFCSDKRPASLPPKHPYTSRKMQEEAKNKKAVTEVTEGK